MIRNAGRRVPFGIAIAPARRQNRNRRQGFKLIWFPKKSGIICLSTQKKTGSPSIVCSKESRQRRI